MEVNVLAQDTLVPICKGISPKETPGSCTPSSSVLSGATLQARVCSLRMPVSSRQAGMLYLVYLCSSHPDSLCGLLMFMDQGPSSCHISRVPFNSLLLLPIWPSPDSLIARCGLPSLAVVGVLTDDALL